MTKETLDELERLHEAATPGTWHREILELKQGLLTLGIGAPSRAICIVDGVVESPVGLANVNAITAIRNAAVELLRSARLALKAREWLVEYSDITGVALSGAEDAEHIKADRSALRALAALRKEFGLDG